MPSPESFPSGEPTDEKAPVEAPETSTETGTDDSEVMGEKERKTYEERGEKTLEAEKATAAEKATKSELEKEREKLQEEIRMLKMRREILIKYGAKPKSERVSDDKSEETTSESDSAAATAAAATAAAATAATVAGAVAGAEKPTSEAKPEGTAEDEPASPEDIKEVKKRAKKNSAARKYAAGVCALIAAAGIGLGIWGAAKSNMNGAPAAITITNEAGEKMKGIYDGYGEKGMYLSEHKTSAVAFADAGEVSEVCNDDEVDMILYTAHNQVESFADYLANLPQELQPDGFKGLSITETEAKLESLSPEDFTALEGTFATIMNNALTRRVTLNGRYDNAYMRVKNPGQDIVHENMELVRCTTNENNLEVTQFYWTDASGREIGNMTVKMTPVRDEKGVIESFKGCEQVVNPEGSSTIYTGMPEIPGPDTPTPPGPDTPTPPGPDTPDLTPKDPQQEIAHAGPDVTPLELDEDVTPPTTLEQDQANFSAIEQQRQEDAARQAEAERVAAQQAEAERQAAAQAEARRQAEAAAQRSAEQAAAEAARQAEANRAAEAAAEQAAQEQQARAAQEAAAAEQAAARQQAQAEANAAAEQAAPEAASHADDSAAERANLFENGDF